jgi:hypothetical protein
MLEISLEIFGGFKQRFLKSLKTTLVIHLKYAWWPFYIPQWISIAIRKDRKNIGTL